MSVNCSVSKPLPIASVDSPPHQVILVARHGNLDYFTFFNRRCHYRFSLLVFSQCRAR
ncbi:unknown protein [Microcystis aeruginosa NIES-843]|uniref:Uncharacterized protein n=1 Tax=Microcystis aeruginosa (strain NIES-843 / IAM M-2473) TaxID=449447 RepID=B0JGP2_MICAN|nr:unknown protein [Microcystis aeruginosa NIES-843]